MRLRTHKEDEGWGKDILDLSTVYVIVRSSWYICTLSPKGVQEAERSQPSAISLPQILQNELEHSG